MGKFNNFMFSVPNLPRTVYSELKALAARFDLDHHQMVILGVMAIKRLNTADKEGLAELVKQVGGMYELPNEPSL